MSHNNFQLQELLVQIDKAKSNSDRVQVEQLSNKIIAITKESDELHLGALQEIIVLLGTKGEYHKAIELSERLISLANLYGFESFVAIGTHDVGNAYWGLGMYDKALEYYAVALSDYELCGNNSGAVAIIGNIGNIYCLQGNYNTALEYYQRAIAEYEKMNELAGNARILSNIAGVYMNMSEYEKSLQYYTKALSIREQLKDQNGCAVIYGNLAGVNLYLKNFALGIEYAKKSLQIHTELDNTLDIAYSLMTLGNGFKDMGDYENALEFYLKSLSYQEKIDDKFLFASSMGDIGRLYFERDLSQSNLNESEKYLLKTVELSTQINAKLILYRAYKMLGRLYKYQLRWEEAFEYFEKYHDLEKEVQSEEAKKQVERLDYERKQTERDKNLAVERAKHEATEQLLHNVLPPSIAHRMIAGESLIAEKLENVSVLFADIVGFTKLSSRISAEELVAGLDRIFSAFDTLAEKHGLEKIKTIGDAYMVVSGAPEPCEDHAQAMAMMALEMMEAMKEFRSISTGEEIQIRIGIHSGEVVAGVIGKKKFAYDLWGDAVNTASRMESHGEAGKIHISDDFRIAVETCRGASPHTIEFIERGEIDIKGKGMMNTYFLERA